MVQIIEENIEPSTSERFGQAFANLGQSLGQLLPQQLLQNQQLKEEIEAGKRFGLDLKGIPSQTRQKAFEQAFKSDLDQKRNIEDRFIEEQSYGKIKDTFGQKFADIWKAAPVGGKTELLKQGIDARLRGANIDELLEGVEPPQTNQMPEEDLKLPQMKNGKLPENFKWPDFTKRPSGYSPKDWIEERKTWRKENSPVFLENKTKLQNSKRDAVSIEKLDKLNKSKKLPEGFERSLINPSTGEIYGIAQLTGSVSPETQEWVKEIARFQNRAKDAFGSRVTNFDLVSYMKQFPGLLNTEEGRNRIIKMMKINNQLDQIYETALQNVYQKYGLNGIPQEEADKLAQSFIQDDIDRLSNEYLGLDEANQSQSLENLSGNIVEVIGPDGQEYEIDEREIEQLPQGFRLK